MIAVNFKIPVFVLQLTTESFGEPMKGEKFSLSLASLLFIFGLTRTGKVASTWLNSPVNIPNSFSCFSSCGHPRPSASSGVRYGIWIMFQVLSLTQIHLKRCSDIIRIAIRAEACEEIHSKHAKESIGVRCNSRAYLHGYFKIIAIIYWCIRIFKKYFSSSRDFIEFLQQRIN